ncbi:hypothetical protein BV22DRAFT_1052627, partial [Leucogyrophana mollusca]
ASQSRPRHPTPAPGVPPAPQAFHPRPRCPSDTLQVYVHLARLQQNANWQRGRALEESEERGREVGEKAGFSIGGDQPSYPLIANTDGRGVGEYPNLMIYYSYSERAREVVGRWREDVRGARRCGKVAGGCGKVAGGCERREMAQQSARRRERVKEGERRWREGARRSGGCGGDSRACEVCRGARWGEKVIGGRKSVRGGARRREWHKNVIGGRGEG